MQEQPKNKVKMSDTVITSTDEQNGVEISLKWDGCCDIKRFWGDGTVDYLHICDIPAFIEQMDLVERLGEIKGFEL